MGAIKDRLTRQIAVYENELTRIDQQAVESKQRVQNALTTLRQAEASLTEDMERLLVDLDGLGIKFTT